MSRSRRTPAAVVASPIHDLDTSEPRLRRRGNLGLRNAEVCKDRRHGTQLRSGRTEAAAAAATTGLRSINRRKTQDAESGEGGRGQADARTAAKNAGDVSGGKRSTDGGIPLPYQSVEDDIGRRIKGPPLIKSATREPISIGRCQERPLSDESMR